MILGNESGFLMLVFISFIVLIRLLCIDLRCVYIGIGCGLFMLCSWLMIRCFDMLMMRCGLKLFDISVSIMFIGVMLFVYVIWF